jgi:diguanylate cyclase (GGDEF)-like protein
MTQTLRVWIMHNRFQIWDLTVALGVGVLLVFLATEYEVLIGSGLSIKRAAGLEGGEVAVIVVIVALFIRVAHRRMQLQKIELHQRISAERRAGELAFLDPLTGLANRRRFDEAVAEAVASPPGAHRIHAILMLDLDRFKAVNDVYGHPVGDKVLTIIADRLAAAVRQSEDVVARLGGDEFAVVARQVFGMEEAASIALRIVDALRHPILVDDNEHTVGVSIGIALFPQDALDSNELVRRSDVALYRAKDESGSAVRFFQEEMDVQVKARARMEAELRRAVNANQIEVHYQPQVDLATGELTGFEALARWNHREWGDVPPERFIPIAEECGLINELGAGILRQACQDAATWRGTASLSVNISPVQLHTPDFGALVVQTLAMSGLPPHRLELEITENTLVRDLQAAQAALVGLREIGVRIALDDFGTGYSSLYHLRNFKVDRIKIDRSFVEGMATEQESAAIVRALLGLGHGLGVKVTAEGIEDAAQCAQLISEGCDEGQGFLFSRALIAVEAEAMTHALAKTPVVPLSMD